MKKLDKVHVDYFASAPTYFSPQTANCDQTFSRRQLWNIWVKSWETFVNRSSPKLGEVESLSRIYLLNFNYRFTLHKLQTAEKSSVGTKWFTTTRKTLAESSKVEWHEVCDDSAEQIPRTNFTATTNISERNFTNCREILCAKTLRPPQSLGVKSFTIYSVDTKWFAATL